MSYHTYVIMYYKALNYSSEEQFEHPVLTRCVCQSLQNLHVLKSASAADWSNKDRAVCYHIYVIIHVKDP